MIIRFKWKIGLHLPRVWIERPTVGVRQTGVWIEQNHEVHSVTVDEEYDRLRVPESVAPVGVRVGEDGRRTAPEREAEGQEAHLLDLCHRLPSDRHYQHAHDPLGDEDCDEEGAASEARARMRDAARRAREILSMPGSQCSKGCCESTDDVGEEALHRAYYQIGDEHWGRPETAAHYGCYHAPERDGDGWFVYRQG